MQQQRRMTRLASRAEQEKLYQLSVIGWEAMEWLDKAEQSCEAREQCGISLHWLITDGSKHLVSLEMCESVVVSNPPGVTVTPLQAGLTKLTKWLERWGAAAAEAAALGLSRDTSYGYWQHNIELPEEVTEATRWFDTAEKLAKAVDTSRLVKFASDGERHIWAVEACRSSWPQFRHWSIQRSFVKWNMLLAEWCELVASTASDQVQAERPDVATMDLITQQLDRAVDCLGDARAEKKKKMERRIRKADMLKKRTCSYCGTTNPLSQVSFAYCGGCRHSVVDRIHWARYCSVECQRAHWLAGHKDECPCVRNE